LVEAQKLGDYRTILCVPMLREGVPIGVLVLTRSEVRPFTDKQIEGTGLGLSICHDIIVKQHGGSIEVETQPGDFTEIRVILPRAAVFVAESEGRA
jgi:nitrogen-specific signal transduction histidine kinase